MDTFADDVMEFDQPFHVVRFDVHEGIDAVVGLRIAGEDILHRIAVLQESVDPLLQQLVGQDLLMGRAVSRREDADAFSQATVKAVGPGVNHAENLRRIFYPVEKRLVQRGADGTGITLEHPFVLLLGKQLGLCLVIVQQSRRRSPCADASAQ